MKGKFNEDSRVKIPALIHLTRLGYNYISKKEIATIHEDTNIIVNEFKKGISKVNNKDYSDLEIKRFIDQISNQLENDDLGKTFYNSLMGNFYCKLIDLDNFENNNLSIVTELTYQKDEDSFRPDITVLINGMPLIFIEVKNI